MTLLTSHSLQSDIAHSEIARLLLQAGPLYPPGFASAPVSESSLADSTLWPDWAVLFEEVILSLSEASPELSTTGEQGAERCFDRSAPEPFEEILVVFVRTGQRHMTAVWNFLSSECQVSFEQQLLRDLSELAGKALWLEFSLFQADRAGLSFLAPALAAGTAPTRTSYRHFIARMLHRSALLSFFQAYPVLARLLSTRLASWLKATARFCERLQNDREALDRDFGIAGCGISSIRPALSDPHNGGQQVIGLTFENGVELIYKPRSLAVEQAFQNLLQWCGPQLEWGFQEVKVLERGAYGWVECVRPAPCQDEDQLERYYWRSGALLGLFYLLRGNDYHYQNVLAAGEYPFSLDQEGLFYPPPPMLTENDHNAQVDDFSVLHTGFLPAWQVPASGPKYDQSGLAGMGHFPAMPQKGWAFINTDCMQPSKPSASLGPVTWPHRPTLAGTGLPARASAYRQQLIEGFRCLTSLVLENRDAWLDETGPLKAFRTATVRFVFRPTQVYHDLLKQSLEPACLRTASERAKLLARLFKSVASSSNLSTPLALVQAEIAHLEQLDIPLFTLRADSLELELGAGANLPAFLNRSGYELVCRQFQQLDQAEVNRQIKYIQASLFSLEAGQIAPGKTLAPLTQQVTTGVEFSPEKALAVAGATAHLLKEQAFKGTDGTGWVFMENSSANRFRRPAAFDFSLYSGQAGVALFLAAYSKISADPAYRQLALDSWQPLLDKLAKENLNVTALNGLGGAMGAASVIYSLVRSGQWLEENSLIIAAGKIARLVFTGEVINGEEQYDVVSGSAGAILGLLALYQETNDPTILELLRTCGQHLLDGELTGPESAGSWATLEGRCWSGFSHGAAGIAYALLRLSQVLPDPAYRQAAQEAIAFERRLYRPAFSNWLMWQGQSEEAANCWATWCHGAPGIGLTRLASLGLLADSSIEQEINLALEVTLKQPLDGLDHLCCGNFGRFDFMIEASLRLKRPELLQSARERAAAILGRAGGFQLSGPHPLHLVSPGFFQGLSGIGYELLRLVAPEKFSSILLWD
ncbi:MAG TPA: type 2 lanthipeptide synthetase LanM family protein [Chloroflexia bacterium]|nr:type 2 lanthipeptide synthetase LanM family protein [Chloroflexia bacterium]